MTAHALAEMIAWAAMTAVLLWAVHRDRQDQQ